MTTKILLTGLVAVTIPQFAFAEKVKIALDWTPNTNHLGLYVAKARGFFKAEKIDPVFIQPAQTTSTQLAATGGADFAISFTSDVLRARNEGIGVRSIAAIIQQNTSCFAWRTNKNIKSPKDWEGKRYGGWGSPEETATLKYLMEKTGADFKKLKIVTTGVSDFIPTTEKHVDFMWIYMGWDGIRAKLAKIPFSTLCMSELPGPFNHHSPLIVTSDKLVKTKKSLGERFMRAASKGYEFAIANPELAASDLLKEVPELDKDLVVESSKYLASEFAKGTKRWGEQSEKVWRDLAEWNSERNFIKPVKNINEYFTNELLPHSAALAPKK